MRSLRAVEVALLGVLAALALALVFAFPWGRSAHATSRAYRPRLLDMSREQDSLPPSRPSVRLVGLHRGSGDSFRYEKTPRAVMLGLPVAGDSLVLVEGRSSSAGEGALELKVQGLDDQTRSDLLAWRARVVAGTLPLAFWDRPQPVQEYIMGETVPDTAACT